MIKENIQNILRTFRDMDEDYRVKGFHENMEQLDELLLKRVWKIVWLGLRRKRQIKMLLVLYSIQL